MRLVVEVDNKFFEDRNDGRKRVYLSFDKEGRQRLIQLLLNPEWNREGQICKLMSDEWGPHELSQRPYYEGTTAAEILELTLTQLPEGKDPPVVQK